MRGYSSACGAHDRRAAFEGYAKKLQRIESTREFQRTGGSQFSAKVLVPDGEGAWEWIEVRAADGNIWFATADAAIEAAKSTCASSNAKRASVLHWTVAIASEYGWITNDEPVWRWTREARNNS